MISHTQESTDELPSTYVGTSVYTAHTSICKYKHLQSYLLIKEQTEHDIGEVCMISSGWYNANTVKNNNDIIIKAHYEIS